VEETHFDGDPADFAEMVYKPFRLDDPPVRLSLHRVAMKAVRKKGESLQDVGLVGRMICISADERRPQIVHTTY
jgi:hypothetical protein